MVRAAAIALMLAAACTAARAEEAAGGVALLPSQSPVRHLGVSSCSSSVCHGAVTPAGGHDVLLNEYVTWAHEDAHARAFASLGSQKSRAIAARLGLADAATAKLCLDCHADNVPAAQRGEKFTLNDGVGCEACHGGAEHWLTTHASRDAGYRNDTAHGMYPTAELGSRARLCLSCHYGTDEKFATHRLMAAGHPRLSFDLDTFLALQPPHYRLDAGYRARKPSYGHTQIWAYGQLASTLAELEALQGPRLSGAALFPELALFNCYGCHMSSMRRTDWNQGQLWEGVEPATVALPDGHLTMSYVIAQQLDPSRASQLLQASRALLHSSAADRLQLVAASRQVATLVTELRRLAARHEWTRAEQRQLLESLLRLGARGELRNYLVAEQTVMAIHGLLIELGLAAEQQQRVNELFRLVQNDESYAPEQLAAVLTQMRTALGTSAPP